MLLKHLQLRHVTEDTEHPVDFQNKTPCADFVHVSNHFPLVTVENFCDLNPCPRFFPSWDLVSLWL